MTKLNIGAGSVEVEGFTPIDRADGLEAAVLDYEDDSVEEIRASHILEHFSHAEVPDVLREWIRVLKPGGRLRLAVPDFNFIAHNYQNGSTAPPDRRLLFAYTMGGQIDENDFHKSLYDEPSLRGMMKQLGLRQVGRWESDVADCAALPVSLNLEGIKSHTVEIPPMEVVMSMPRLAMTANWWCAEKVFNPRRIDLIHVTGAYWGPCLERGMTQALERDGSREWVATMDYDTVFTGDQFDELCYIMATRPDIDALAPFQMKREDESPLMWIENEDGTPRDRMLVSELDEAETLEVASAHFGLTLFRGDALRRMEHPWFHGRPNDDGRWEEGRVDDDIAFWQKWRECGNTVHIATGVPIGHMQTVITWPRRDLRPVHQYVSAFQNHGPPEEVRQ